MEAYLQGGGQGHVYHPDSLLPHQHALDNLQVWILYIVVARKIAPRIDICKQMNNGHTYIDEKVIRFVICNLNVYKRTVLKKGKKHTHIYIHTYILNIDIYICIYICKYIHICMHIISCLNEIIDQGSVLFFSLNSANELKNIKHIKSMAPSWSKPLGTSCVAVDHRAPPI